MSCLHLVFVQLIQTKYIVLLSKLYRSWLVDFVTFRHSQASFLSTFCNKVINLLSIPSLLPKKVFIKSRVEHRLFKRQRGILLLLSSYQNVLHEREVTQHLPANATLNWTEPLSVITNSTYEGNEFPGFLSPALCLSPLLEGWEKTPEKWGNWVGGAEVCVKEVIYSQAFPGEHHE